MMHESVTKSPSPANFYQHKSEDILSNNQAKAALSSRDMLPASGGASRRPQSVGLQKPERSARPTATNANGGEWDITDDMVKLQISEDAPEHKSHLRTPPHLRGHIGVVGIETSPLETSSETSLGSESPNAFDQAGTLGSHSRGSSADTTASSHTPSYSGPQTLQAPPYTPLKASGVNESRNRPHSYSGGLSSADLMRLQQAGGSPGIPETWSSPNGTPERQQAADQPTYPSLVGQNASSRSQEALHGSRGDESQGSYETPSRQQYGPIAQAPTMHAAGSGVPNPPYPAANRPNSIAPPNPQFRQRAFSPPQPVPQVMQSPPNFGYPAPLPLSVAGGQQLYDMMLPTPPLENPTMARLQQQAPYRGVHQHSASDPASLRDPAVLALLNSNMQAAFAAGQMYGPAAMVPPNMAMFNQFYTGPEGYPSPDLAMMARLQPQYTGQYGIPSAQGGAAAARGHQSAQSTGSSPGPGPNANNRKLGLYKTELCRSWEEKGTCRYGAKCQFAHGEEELRNVQRHPKYKTEICRTFWVSGSCPYGKRCCFIHTELPGAAGQGGQDNSGSLGVGEQRPRSDSDPNEGSTSLLARISAKRQDPLNGTNKPGSVSTTPPGGFSGRPGSLRVDTSVLDPSAGKQNKSAFPSFTHNGILVSSNDEAPAMSPGPVTAAPDFGRHAAARMDIVGAQPRVRKSTGVDPNVRHSFNGGEIQLDLSASTPTAPNQGQFAMPADMQPGRAARLNGHARSGSAGNWGAATRAPGHLTAYPLSSIPGGELKANMPWADYPAARRTGNNWA